MERVTNRRIAGWTATVILVGLGFVFLWQIRSVIFLVFISILLATGIEPVVNFLRKRGPFSRATGALFVYSLIFGLLALALYLILPPLFSQSQQFVTNLANKDTAQQAINRLPDFLRDPARQAYESAGSVLQNVEINSQIVSVGLTFFEAIFSAITVFVVAFYWLTDRASVKTYFLSILGDKQRSRGQQVWHDVETKLGAWVRGQLILMLVIGVFSGIGYAVMGLKFAVFLGVFAGLTELIPVVGPILGGVPPFLIALSQEPILAVAVVIFVIVLQFLEGNILVPRIMEKAVGVTPLAVIIGLLIGSTLAGIAGALLAVPVAAMLQVLIKSFFIRSPTDPTSTDSPTKDGQIPSAKFEPAEPVTNNGINSTRPGIYKTE